MSDSTSRILSRIISRRSTITSDFEHVECVEGSLDSPKLAFKPTPAHSMEEALSNILGPSSTKKHSPLDL